MDVEIEVFGRSSNDQHYFNQCSIISTAFEQKNISINNEIRSKIKTSKSKYLYLFEILHNIYVIDICYQ